MLIYNVMYEVFIHVVSFNLCNNPRGIYYCYLVLLYVEGMSMGVNIFIEEHRVVMTYRFQDYNFINKNP